MSAESVALEHYRKRAALTEAISSLAARIWRRVDPGDLDASWARLGPQMVVGVAGAQLAAARMADGYADAELAEQDMSSGSDFAVVADRLAGIASDGRPLESLLQNAITTVKASLAGGATLDRAMAGGYANLDMLARTQVADAGRVADGVAIVARPEVTGYRRMLVGKSCSRCVVLAGRWYRYNTGFDRHPRCFPAGVLVDGPRSEAATRRWFQGELVVLATASGQKLPLTGNHPVLTRRGWVPARLLQEGDEVVRRTRTEGATALVVPDHDQVPSRIEDVWGALGVPLLGAVESSPEDFHGDGQHGKVDVVWADRALDDRVFAALPQHLAQLDLARAAGSALALDRQGAAELLDLADAPHAGRSVGIGGLSLALFGSLLRGADGARLAHAAALHSGLGEDAGDWSARDAVLLGQPELAGPGQVGGHDGLGGQVENLARWDAPAGAFSVETRGGYAARGLDLLQRLTGQVELDRLVEVRRVDWSGHVYSLTSSEGWHSANSLIVSNCDCIHVPAAESADDVTTNPRTYFDSLTKAEQDKTFTKAGAEAIRDGADIGQVVNARRGAYGLTPAGARITAEEAELLRGGRQVGRLQTQRIFGEDLFVTTEGTTTRGQAGRGLGANETGVKDGGRYRRAKAPRLMPESIYKIAGNDRDEAIRLLRRNGYIVDRKPAPAKRAPAKAAAPKVAAAPKAPAVRKPLTPPAAPKHAVVKGRDRLADEAALTDSGAHDLVAVKDRAKRTKWDPELAAIGKRQGFDGLPQVATRAEMDAAVRSGWTQVWRGVVGGDDITAAGINGRFRTGPYEPGRGIYGNGWYVSERRITGENYRGREPMTNFPAGGGEDFELSDLDGELLPDSLLRLAINPAAWVVDYDELIGMQKRWEAGQPIGTPGRVILGDIGRFAAAQGYDVIRVGPGHPDGGFYPGWEDTDDEGGAVQWIVLNRTAVMVQRAEDVP